MIKVKSYIERLIPYKPGKSSDPSDFARYKAILSSNENNYGPSPLAISAMMEAAKSVHLYPDPQGEKLIAALSAKYSFPPEHFILSNGLDGLLYSIYKAFTSPGDQVITNEKSFVAFNKFGAMYDVEVSRVPNIDYVFDLDTLLDHITSKTKIIYLCNPNNPTGGLIPSKKLKHLLERIPKHILTIVDEAYFEYADHMESDILDSSSLGMENVLTLRTFSKLYGLAGVRIGFAMGSESVISILKKVKLVFNPNTLAQAAAIAALQDETHINTTLLNNTFWIKKLEAQLDSKGISYIKSHANFVCTIFEDSTKAAEFHAKMDENGILLRKLDGFQMPEGVRVSIGNDKEMQYFSEVLNRF